MVSLLRWVRYMWRRRSAGLQNDNGTMAKLASNSALLIVRKLCLFFGFMFRKCAWVHSCWVAACCRINRRDGLERGYNSEESAIALSRGYWAVRYHLEL